MLLAAAERLYERGEYRRVHALLQWVVRFDPHDAAARRLLLMKVEFLMCLKLAGRPSEPEQRRHREELNRLRSEVRILEVRGDVAGERAARERLEDAERWWPWR